MYIPGTVNIDVGYYDSNQVWLVTQDDFTTMYARFKGGGTLILWCDARVVENGIVRDLSNITHVRKGRMKLNAIINSYSRNTKRSLTLQSCANGLGNHSLADALTGAESCFCSVIFF